MSKNNGLVHVWRDCPSCGGSGKKPISTADVTASGPDSVKQALMLRQGICIACNGNGGKYYEIDQKSPDAVKARDRCCSGV